MAVWRRYSAEKVVVPVPFPVPFPVPVPIPVPFPVPVPDPDPFPSCAVGAKNFGPHKIFDPLHFLHTFFKLKLTSSKEKIFFVPHGGVAAILCQKSCGSGSVSGSVSGSGSDSGSGSGSGSATLVQISTFL